MSVLKRTVILLLLAAIGANAAPGPEDCHGLNVTIPRKDLNKIIGDWVMIWSVANNAASAELLANLTSSRVDLRMEPDTNVLIHNERNLFRDKTCARYFINMTIPSDEHITPTYNGKYERNGVLTNYNDSATVDFFETCADCLNVFYNGTVGQFLVSYRREGHYQDVEQNKAAHTDLETLADCLRIPHDKPFIYDGTTDFCQKKTLAEASEQS